MALKSTGFRKEKERLLSWCIKGTAQEATVESTSARIFTFRFLRLSIVSQIIYGQKSALKLFDGDIYCSKTLHKYGSLIFF